VALATAEALGEAKAAGHSHVTAMSLSSGELRTFPPAFAVQEMARAWSIGPHEVSLTIALDDECLSHDLRSGRLDIGAVANMPPVAGARSVLRLWIEIAERRGSQRRFVEVRDCTEPLRTLLAEFSVLNERWEADVWPRPSLQWTPWTAEELNSWETEQGAAMTLERFGLCHGSTLRVTERLG
jgi:hypothetical protein